MDAFILSLISDPASATRSDYASAMAHMRSDGPRADTVSLLAALLEQPAVRAVVFARAACLKLMYEAYTYMGSSSNDCRSSSAAERLAWLSDERNIVPEEVLDTVCAVDVPPEVSNVACQVLSRAETCNCTYDEQFTSELIRRIGAMLSECSGHVASNALCALVACSRSLCGPAAKAAMVSELVVGAVVDAASRFDDDAFLRHNSFEGFVRRNCFVALSNAAIATRMPARLLPRVFECGAEVLLCLVVPARRGVPAYVAHIQTADSVCEAVSRLLTQGGEGVVAARAAVKAAAGTRLADALVALLGIKRISGELRRKVRAHVGFPPRRAAARPRAARAARAGAVLPGRHPAPAGGVHAHAAAALRRGGPPGGASPQRDREARAKGARTAARAGSGGAGDWGGS